MSGVGGVVVAAEAAAPVVGAARVVLVGLAALVGAYVFVTVSDTLSVLVAARDLEPGEPITVDDLRVVEMGRTSDLRAIQPAQQDLILGRSPVGPVPAGTLLNTGLFVDADEVVPPGMAVIGGAFEAGAVPTAALGPGDPVVLLAAADTTTGQADGAVATVLGEGRVFAVEGAAATDSSARVWVSLLIAEDLQAAAAEAAADGRLRLSLAAGSGGMIALFSSVAGSPGTTSWSLLTGAAWPADYGVERVVLEAARDGGVLGARYQLGVEPGVSTLAAAVRRHVPGDPLPVAELVGRSPAGLWVVPGPESAEATATVWSSVSAVASAIAADPRVWLVDAGRSAPGGFGLALAAQSSLSVVVSGVADESLVSCRPGCSRCSGRGRRWLCCWSASPGTRWRSWPGS